MDFYFISPELINYLKEYETKERGLTKVPNIEYDKSHNPKFFIGTVLEPVHIKIASKIIAKVRFPKYRTSSLS